MKQLNKWITSIDEKLVEGLTSLSKFTVIEHNYDEIDDKEQYFEYIKVNANWEFIEIPEYCLKVNPNFVPKEIDITNELFLGSEWFYVEMMVRYLTIDEFYLFYDKNID